MFAIAGTRGPVELYARLFGQVGETAEQRTDRLNKKRSILDIVLSDAKSLDRKISATDKDKLNEYFQSIREVELGLEGCENFFLFCNFIFTIMKYGLTVKTYCVYFDVGIFKNLIN